MNSFCCGVSLEQVIYLTHFDPPGGPFGIA